MFLFQIGYTKLLKNKKNEQAIPFPVEVCYHIFNDTNSKA